MKKITLLLSAVVLVTVVSAQPNKSIDSLANRICSMLEEEKNQPDSVLIIEAYAKHILPYMQLMNMPLTDSAIDIVYVRAQRQCKTFNALVARLTPMLGDWQLVEEKPVIKASVADCRAFMKTGRFTYLEPNGDTVHVSIGNGLWTDHFNDGTYSQLKIKFSSECAFALEFVKSTNESRSKLSKPGDKYFYQVVEKGNHYFYMSVEVKESQEYETFKLYYE
ncbi:MAG: hypothetical protein JST86_14820 [Bacteroidetes bacterium]|nr:hypothetical protein [Bacteroidota bacterium]